MCDLLVVSDIDKDIANGLSFRIRKVLHYRYFNNLITALKEIPRSEDSILVLDCDYVNTFSTKSIFTSSLYNDLHVIALTSDESLENIRNIKERNISQILIKPINNDRLENIISNILIEKNILAGKRQIN